MRRAWLWAGLAGLGLYATGCTIESSYSPLGSDVGLAATWTLNGQSPNGANCSAAGIDRIRIVFYDGSFGGDAFYSGEFEFFCEDGGFETSGPVLDYGYYYVQWQALDAGGGILATYDQEFDTSALPYGTIVDLGNVDFVFEATVDLTVNLNFAIGDGTYGTCSAAKLTDFAYALSDSGGAVDSGNVSCGATPIALEFQGLPVGAYTLATDLYDQDTLVRQVDCEITADPLTPVVTCNL